MIVDNEYFVRQLMVHRKRIYAFILTLVPNSPDAEDIMQETAALMWEKFQENHDITNFAAWAVKIAHFKILEYRKKRFSRHVLFDDELFNCVLEETSIAAEKIDARYEAMKKCLSKLDPQFQKILYWRHQEGWTVKTIAENMNINPYNIYKLIPRIHDILLRCIRRTMKMEEAI